MVPSMVKALAEGVPVGVVMPRNCTELVARARDAGVLLIVSAENRIRLLPPLVITAEEADLLVEKVSALVRTFLGEEVAA